MGALRLAGTGLRGELLPLFARLGALQALALGSNWALSGDVADLAAATTLRSLDLSGCPLVRGELETLAPLGRLGLGCSLCDGGVGVRVSSVGVPRSASSARHAADLTRRQEEERSEEEEEEEEHDDGALVRFVRASVRKRTTF